MKGFSKYSRQEASTESGFTLVEVFIGLVIFAFIATTLFQTIRLGYSIMGHTRDVTRITQIMQYQAENIRGSSWNTVKSLKGTNSISVDKYGIPTSGKGVTPFGWSSFTLTQILTEKKSDLYVATLTANWTNNQGKSFSRTITTTITEKGINEYYIRTTN